MKGRVDPLLQAIRPCKTGDLERLRCAEHTGAANPGSASAKMRRGHRRVYRQEETANRDVQLSNGKIPGFQPGDRRSISRSRTEVILSGTVSRRELPARLAFFLIHRPAICTPSVVARIDQSPRTDVRGCATPMRSLFPQHRQRRGQSDLSWIAPAQMSAAATHGDIGKVSVVLPVSAKLTGS